MMTDEDKAKVVAIANKELDEALEAVKNSDVIDEGSVESVRMMVAMMDMVIHSLSCLHGTEPVMYEMAMIRSIIARSCRLEVQNCELLSLVRAVIEGTERTLTEETEGSEAAADKVWN